MNKYKEYHKKYYLEHKDVILERNKKWVRENKERFYELVYKSRKKKADMLRDQGLDYVWASEVKRKELYKRRNERINKSIKKEKI